ncbi:MAG: hypothetical protein M3N57_01490 [Actinomycetota bacterium]|nr:hypothetical protein [Actinomycetota bacterium]
MRSRASSVLLLVVLVALVGVAAGSASAQPPARVVDILEFSGPVDPPVVAAVADLVSDANRRDAELVVVSIDAPAGVAIEVDDVVAPLVSSDVPVAVWVGPADSEAAGAGALLLAAAHIRAASSVATVGPACPLTVTVSCGQVPVGDLGSRLPPGGDAVLAGTATQRLAAAQARQRGAVDLVVDGIESLLVELDGREVVTAAGVRSLRLRSDEVTVRLHKLGLLRRTLHAALSPSFVYLVVVATLLLLLFEVFQPGFGVAGVAALLLAPLAVYGVIVLPVAWWALALVVAGMLLLAVDLAIAGLGVPTGAGAAALGAGSWFFYASDAPLLRLSPWLIVAVVAGSVIFFGVIMTVVLRAQAGPEAAAVADDLVGRVAVVRSTMNPEGHVFVDGALWRARWLGEDRGRIKAGTRVRIHGVDGAVLLVDDVERTVGVGN